MSLFYAIGINIFADAHSENSVFQITFKNDENKFIAICICMTLQDIARTVRKHITY